MLSCQVAVDFDRFCNHLSQMSVWAVFGESSLGTSPRISCILNSSPACPTMGCDPSGFTMKRHRCVTQPHRLVPRRGRSLPVSSTRGPQHCLGCWQQCRPNNLNLNAIMNLKWGTFALMSASRTIAVATCFIILYEMCSPVRCHAIQPQWFQCVAGQNITAYPTTSASTASDIPCSQPKAAPIRNRVFRATAFPLVGLFLFKESEILPQPGLTGSGCGVCISPFSLSEN